VIEAAGDVGQRRQQQIAEGVSGQRFSRREAVGEQLRKQLLLLRERDDAVADVSGRQDAQLPSQLTELPPSSVTVTIAPSRLIDHGPSAPT